MKGHFVMMNITLAASSPIQNPKGPTSKLATKEQVITI
jgi:hypothetical protein